MRQRQRILNTVGGFTLILVGVPMLVLPGPGALAILLGLGLLAAEYVWAQRLMLRVKREGARIRGFLPSVKL